MKKLVNCLFVFVLFFGCQQQGNVPFPFKQTEYSPPKVVKATPTIHQIPDSLPNAQYEWDKGYLITRIPNIPLAKPKVVKVGKTKTIDTGFEAYQIPKKQPNSQYTTINRKLELRDQSIPLIVPKPVELGKTDTLIAKGKIVIATLPSLFPFVQPTRQDNDRFGILQLSQNQNLPSTTVTSILLDRNGLAWLGTDNGLACIDGNTIRVYTSENGLASNNILSLLEDTKGRIWIGTRGGINLLDGGTITQFTTSNGLTNNIINCLEEDSKGRIWIGTFGGGVNIFEEGSFTQISKKSGLLNNFITSIVEDSKGRIWIGSQQGGLNLFEGGRFTHFINENGLSSFDIRSLLEDSKGRIWIGTQSGGLNLLENGVFTHFTKENGLSSNDIRGLLEDSKGRIWIGTQNGGLNLLEGETIKHFNNENGLSSDTISNLLEDDGGRIWIGTGAGGLNFLEGGSYTFFNKENGLSNHFVLSILEDSKGRTWYGTNGGGVNLLQNGAFTQYDTESGLSHNSVWSLMEDSKGRIWMGTNGAGINILENGSITQIGSYNGLSNNTILSLMEDTKGRIWIGTYRGGLNLLEGDRFTHYTTDNGLSNNIVADVIEDSKGRIWIGTLGGGLNLLENGSFTHFTTSNGLSDNSIYSLLEDEKGRIWIGTEGGGLNMLDGEIITQFKTENGLANNSVVQLAMDSLGHIWAGTGRGLTRITEMQDSSFFLKKWTTADGFKFMDFIAPGNPMIFDKKGTMWTGVGLTLTAFNPPLLDILAPKMFLTGVDIGGRKVSWNKPNYFKSLADTLFMADGGFITSANLPTDTTWLNQAGVSWKGVENKIPFWLPNELSLPYDQNHLTFHYSGMKYEDQVNLVYRFMLEGFDESWSSFTKEGKAEYRNIPPGKFTFKVRSRGPNFVWSEASSFSFIVLPPWWQTWWAFSVYLVLLGSFILGIVKWNIRRLEQDKIVLEGIVEVRTEELKSTLIIVENERHKSEKLLLNILPKDTADELKEKGYATTKRFEKVSVLFTDFKGFTLIAEKMEPEQVVQNLDYCFKAFDRICKQHRLEKIKTIGDAYMAAGGIPIADEDNPQRAVAAALEMATFMSQWKSEKEAIGEQAWEVRIGIHTGPVVAGVVGEDKFAYDIWGDTVNTASRLESSGQPGRVNISEYSYRLLIESNSKQPKSNNYGLWNFEYRGELAAKNKGNIGMYFVER